MRFSFTLPTSNILSANFDSGEVEANSTDEARVKAMEKLDRWLFKVNEALTNNEGTYGFFIQYHPSSLVIELIP